MATATRIDCDIHPAVGGTRTTRPALPVLFITGYAENAIIGNDQLAPGMAVLTKPFVVEALANRVLDMVRAGAAT